VTEPVDTFPMFHNPDKLPALFDALAAAQKNYKAVVRDKLVVQKLKDKQTGAYTGASIKFLYADLAAVLAATIPALSEQGLSFIQTLQHDGELIWLHSILAHKDGGAIVSRMLIPGGGDMKVFGGNVTYVRRYVAAPMLGVSSEDDADENGEPADAEAWEAPAAPKRQPSRKSAQAEQPAEETIQGATLGQVKNLQAKIAAAGLSDSAVANTLARLSIPAIAVGMSVDHWKLLKADIEKVI
tara:strand:- start:358 stop:1080 length:723 start_codon:yes stop_codon:yes gene_type:complete